MRDLLRPNSVLAFKMAARVTLGRVASARMVGSRLQAMLQAVESVLVRAVPISAMAYPRSCQGLVLPGPVVLYQKRDRRATVRRYWDNMDIEMLDIVGPAVWSN